jgi:ribosomal protein S1
MVGSQIDYVVLEIDREGGCAIASRRVALAAKRHYFSTARTGHREGDLLKCRVMAVGAKHCTVECAGYDLRLSQRDLSYTAIPDLRTKYHPGQELTCRLKEFDKDAGRLIISVKEAAPNPFIGADRRHPIGSRRQAVISGKYAGGVFCTLPDGTVCLCLYSSRHSDANFAIGDSVIIAIREYNYSRQLIFGRLLAKW